MYQRWIGPMMVLLILGGVGAILLLNLNLKGTGSRTPESPPPPAQAPASPSPRPTGFREYPIGDDVERNHMRIAAVWLPPVQIEGMNGPAPSDMIHIEADIHATAENLNGCALNEFIPYLTVRYAIVPQGETAKSLEPIRGDLMPMVARDGWHYGASIPMPRAGHFKLTYSIDT